MLSDTILEKNLNSIRKNNAVVAEKIQKLTVPEEEYQVLSSKKESPYLIVGNIAYNSKMNPEREAGKRLKKADFDDKDLIILGGMELGYGVKECCELHPDIPVLLVESDWNIVKLALCVHDLTKYFEKGQLELLVPEKSDVIQDYLKFYQAKNIGLNLHRPSYEKNKEFYDSLQEGIGRYVSTQEVNLLTLTRFEKLWFKNVILNMGPYLFGKGVESLFGQFKDMPMLLVGAGPSLQKQLPLIKARQKEVVMVAVNTSMPYLIQNDIIPDFVIAVDPQDKVYRYFLPIIKNKLPRYPVLIAEPTISPKIVHNYPGRVVFCQVSFLHEWVLSFSEPKGELETGGSVITTAFSLARKTGASPIIFVGTDMAYTGKTLHFRGAELEKEWLYSSNRLYSEEKQNYAFLKQFKLSPHEGFYGDTVYTDIKFTTYINWLEQNFKLFKNLDIINASEGGIRFQHIRNEPLKEVLDSFRGVEVKKLKDFSDEDLLNPKYREEKKLFSKNMKMMKEEFPKLLRYAKKGKKLADQLYVEAEKKQLDPQKLDELDKLDKKIIGFENTEVLSLSIQKVIHQVNENIDGVLTEEESKDPALKAIRFSVLLYQGLLESLQFSLAQIKKAERYLLATDKKAKL